MDYTLDTFRELPFDKLRTLHREMGALIAEKRTEALEHLRSKRRCLASRPTTSSSGRKRGTGSKSAAIPTMPGNPTVPTCRIALRTRR